MRHPVIYVSGPYTKGDPVVNVRIAIAAGNNLLINGYTPIIPHLSVFWHFLYPHSWDTWIDYDMHLIPLCEGLLRLPGESTGADLEVAEAQRLDIPVVFTLQEVYKTFPREP